MPDAIRDRWAEWLLKRRSGGDAERRNEMSKETAAFRGRVLDNADLRPDDVLLVKASHGMAFDAIVKVLVDE